MSKMDVAKGHAMRTRRHHIVMLDKVERALPFNAVINGKSVYDLDRKELEELVVLVDWHLNRRDS